MKKSLITAGIVVPAFLVVMIFGRVSRVKIDAKSEVFDHQLNLEQAVDPGKVVFDDSQLGKGFLGVSVIDDTDVVVRITQDGYKRVWPIKNDGSANVLPFSASKNPYDVLVAEDNGETGIFLGEYTVQSSSDSDEVFLAPSMLVPYDEFEEVLMISRYLASISSNEEELLRNTVKYIESTYAQRKWYGNDDRLSGADHLNHILDEKSGACLDFATLFAALMRANGVPCKVVLGDVVGESRQAHAWNEVKINGEWRRVDLILKPKSSVDYIETMAY